MAKKQLSPAVADKYTLNTVEPGKHNFNGYGIVDLTTLSVEEADTLVSAGFPYLLLKTATAAAKKDADKA